MPKKTPPLFISYGMTKSGSTLAFELQKEVFRSAGADQSHLDIEQNRSRHINYTWNRDDFEPFFQVAQSLGRSLVVKTHSTPSEFVQDKLREGEIHALATYRDPRDIALSMLDHGARLREANHSGKFATMLTVEDTLDALDAECRNLLRWKPLPNVHLYSYASVAFSTEQTLLKMADVYGIEVDAENVLSSVLGDGRTLQYNKGVRDRHKTEMPMDLQRRIVERVGFFYEEMGLPRV